MLLLVFVSIYIIIGLVIGVLAAYDDYNVKPHVMYGWFMAIFWLPAFLIAIIMIVYSRVHNYIKEKKEKRSEERRDKM